MTSAPVALSIPDLHVETFPVVASQPISELSAPQTPLQRFALRIEEWLERVEAEAGVDPCRTST